METLHAFSELPFRDEKQLASCLKEGLELLEPGQPALKVMRQDDEPPIPSTCADDVDPWPDD